MRMINTKKVKERIREKKTTIAVLAERIYLTAYSLGQKIRNNKPMTLSEAFALAALLEIPDAEFFLYFRDG